MNSKFAVLIGLIFLSGCAGFHPQSDRATLQLNGGVKKMEVIQKYAIELSDTIIAGKENHKNTWLYRFNHQGNKLKEKSYFSYKDKDIKDSTLFLYNNQKELIGQKNYTPFSGLWNTYHFIYNSNHQLIEKKCYIPKWNKLAKQWNYTYNKRGFRITEKSQNFRNGQNRLKHFARKANGLIKQIDLYGNSGQLISKTTFKYRKRQCIEKTKFDAQNQLISQIKFKYNLRGQLTEKIIFKAQTQSTTHYNYTYRFDKHANWIIKIILKNKIPLKVVERKLTYFTN